MSVLDSPWRLFFALDPSHALRQRLAVHSAHWNWDARARPSAAHKLHITLVFMPRVDPARVGDLLQVGAAAAESGRGCTMLLDKAEVWQTGGIAHLSPSCVPPALLALHDLLLDGALAAGIPVDRRTWRPHLTLARKARSEQAPTTFEPLPWQIRGFSLQRSRLGSESYEVLARWPLSRRTG